jgi:hypothetical protein
MGLALMLSYFDWYESTRLCITYNSIEAGARRERVEHSKWFFCCQSCCSIARAKCLIVPLLCFRSHRHALLLKVGLIMKLLEFQVCGSTANS